MLNRRQLLRGPAALSLAAAFGQDGTSRSPTEPAGVTQQVARFIVDTEYRGIPEDVVELGKKSILDGLGLALSGSVAETGPLSRKYVELLGVRTTGATVIGSKMKAPARFAAFINGIAIHADDYDDTQLAAAENRVYGLLTHPTAPVLPAALALAEIRGLSGRDLMAAYHTGVEVACKVAEAIAPRHYDEGFHSTGTCGAIGAGAAAARILNLDVQTTLRTLAIAASSASGLRENFGTMTKPLHAGRASDSGVAAAEMAALSWTAAEGILEAPRGFFRAAGGGFDPKAIAGKLGNPWTFRTPRISIKPHPSGSLTHPGMTELLRIIREHAVKPDEVERLDVGTNRNMPNALIHHSPVTALQAKFSMEFCMAALLLYGKAGLREFTDEVVNRAEVRGMMRRVQFAVHPEAEAAGYNKMTTILELRLRGGKTLRGRADFGKGSPAIPMSYDEVAEKFLDCAAFANWPREKAKSAIEAVRGLESVRDIRTLTSLFAG